MADTALTIANRALQQAGARSTMASLGENSNEAKNVNQIFNTTMTEVLTEVRWNFTSTYATGVRAPAPASPQWGYAFLLPTDLLAMRGVFGKAPASQAVPLFGAALSAISSPVGGKVPYALAVSGGARVVLCNASACVLWYTATQLDFGQWEPLALSLLEYRLAAKLAIPLSGDKTLAQMLAQKAEQTKMAAQLIDANDDTAVQDVPPDWMLARDWGGGIPGETAPIIIDAGALPDPSLLGVTRGQFLQALEASGAGRVATVQATVLSDPSSPSNIAWYHSVFVTADSTVATLVKAALGLTDADIQALLLEARGYPGGFLGAVGVPVSPDLLVDVGVDGGDRV